MRWPDRLLTDIAAECSHRAGKKVTERTIRLALALRVRAENGKSLDDSCRELGGTRPREHVDDDWPYSRNYFGRIASMFGISFPDFEPRNPLNLPLE